jgi:hypothetical protein
MNQSRQSVKRNIVAPEVLPDRPLLKENTYQSDGEAYSIDSVGVSFSATAKRKHLVKAPTGDSDVAETLRRYVLVRSRYDLPDHKKYAKRWKVSEVTVEAACRTLANARYYHAFEADPSIGTTETNILARVLSEGNPPKPAILSALSHAGTQAFTELLSKVTDPNIVMELKGIEEQILTFMYNYDLAYRLTTINSSNPRAQKRGLKEWAWYTKHLDAMADNQVNEQRGRLQEEQRRQEQQTDAPQRAFPKDSTLIGDWEQLVVSKPELSINHTGKLGRRTIAADSGRELRYLNRMVTDPDKRVFSRKTRALGGVVVIDASGSMSLSEDDLDRLLKASAGATVLMYSGGLDHPEKPNVWLIARKGRMVRHLPDPPGDNAVDGPALVYASTLRERGSQPLIWVSDGHVTGRRSGSSNANLQKDMEMIIRKHRVVQVRNVQEAEKLMRRLQGGSR